MSLINKEPFITPEMIAAWNAGGGGYELVDEINIPRSDFALISGQTYMYRASTYMSASSKYTKIKAYPFCLMLLSIYSPQGGTTLELGGRMHRTSDDILINCLIKMDDSELKYISGEIHFDSQNSAWTYFLRCNKKFYDNDFNTRSTMKLAIYVPKVSIT